MEFDEVTLYQLINKMHSKMNVFPKLRTKASRAFARFTLTDLLQNYSAPALRNDLMKLEAMKRRIMECFPVEELDSKK